MAAISSSAGPSAPQWRSFTFFDADDVKDNDDLAQSPRSIRTLTQPIILTPTSPNSPLPPSLIVSSSNNISIFDRHFNVERTFKAWENNGRATALLEAGGLLLAIGEEEGIRWPVLKIWDLTREEKRKITSKDSNGISEIERGPVLVRNTRIQHVQRPHPVSSIALTSNLSHLAIGLGDGTVLLYRHLLQSLTTSPTSLNALPKARVIHESNEPITGLGFRESQENSSSSGISLFIVTTNRILSAPVSGKGGETRTIDELGCGLGCAVMDWNRKEMIVARDEAIYLYNGEGRGACYAYEGPKSSIAIYQHNLIIISPPFYPSANSASATVRHYVSKTSTTTTNSDGVTLPTTASDISKVTIFDLQNKLVSYSGTYRDGVREVFCQWGGIFVYGGNSKLTRLSEHTTLAKLDVLYRRNLFTLAISLARSQGIGKSGVADIHKRYGDYLYSKGDFDGAMGQFVKTLGELQPSYVIRKFLDAQRIHNLTTYLQELHSRGLANPDHTTLLLNCYTKTSDRARLDSFIKTEARRSDISGDEELPFDLDTAIRVCRQAGFYEHATYLAKKFGRHEEYLRIQIEDAGEIGEALRYLRNLGPEAAKNMVRYGRTLLNAEPEATTSLLIDLCSGDLGKKKAVTPTLDVKSNGAAASSAPAMLSYLGYNRVTGLFTSDSPTTAPAAEANGRQTSHDGEKGDAPNGGLDAALITDDEPSYIPPSPRQYFPHFVDHRDLFITFLESVAMALWNQSLTSPRATINAITPSKRRDVDSAPPEDAEGIDQRAVWNTLLELYLASTNSIDEKKSKSSTEKALAVIQDDSLPYDPMHALILCSTSGFEDGMIKLWEQMGMYEDIIRFYIQRPFSSNSSEKVLRHLDLYGSQDLNLYPLVLRYLTSSPAILSKHPKDLIKIISKIDEERIMPPLAIVQLLSRNGVASIGNIKDWLRSKVEENKDQIESDKHLVESYRSETSTKKKAIQDLSNVDQPEVFQVTRCAACGGQLDLPSVHFMCKHSYHQRCLSDSEPECILCARQHSVIRELRRNQTRLADRHDLFIDEVKDSEDGFGVVAGAFGRGLMGKERELNDVV
uniref:E3 ubiquitin-protein ligase PEP5 n=1 Tax=Kwoniella pini CBS 10737 TaxID=1296096 RepID=A0A1B9I8E7_9TREE|nr:vacuolar membrane protein [Kwoniella pini CBS 10737]OCF51817.1 vacuolar membrane protein [Kwoniella pini CBS 10737]